MKHAVSFVLLGLVVLLATPAPSAAQYNGVPRSGSMTSNGMPAGITPSQLKMVAFDQNLGVQVPPDLAFRDEHGAEVHLSRYFKDRPVVLALVYYGCPVLCTQALNGLVKSLKVLALEPGRDYELVTVSFNPDETPKEAAAKKAEYVAKLKRAGGGQAWHFLTGDEASIRPLTETVGFHYVYDAPTRQYAHPTGIIVLTPDGRTSKYIYGIDYGPRDLRLALIEASNHRIGTPVDRLLLYCYHYDPATGKYSLVLLNVIRLGGVVTVAFLAGFILLMVYRERRARASLGGPNAPIAN